MSSAPHTSTGYGAHSTGGRWSNLQFNGDERLYEQWEVKFMGYMRLKNLKSTINPDNTDAVDADKNDEAFAELIQFIDPRSLSLIMRDARDKGREALMILREHYRGKGKQRIICLYTELTTLSKRSTESTTDYVIRAENASTALQDAGEVVSDGLLVAMVLKGLPPQFKSFVVVVTQSDKDWSFKDLKVSLRDYEDTENARRGDDKNSQIMKSNFNTGAFHAGGNSNFNNPVVTCYSCGTPGHKSNQCNNKPRKKWCKSCKSSTHNDDNCRRKQHNNKGEKVKVADEVSHYHTFNFKVGEGENCNAVHNKKVCSFLVDSGCTSHIVIKDSGFIDFDDTFEPENHFIELADGRKSNNVALKRGSVKINLTDTAGKTYDSILNNCLYIPSYPENIFSIKAATLKGSSINFHPNYAELVTKNGTCFEIKNKGKLYYLNDVTFVKRVCDLEKWHEILGHCNKKDILKLESVVEGMKIHGKTNSHCEPCILGKQTKFTSKKTAARANHPLEFVSSDVCGPISPVSSDGFKYVVSFIDNYSGYTFLYFMKEKSDATRCLKKFLADISPLGKICCLLDITDSKVKTLRSDGGGEFMGKVFKQVLIDNNIKHEQSAPYSPHQNGIAERGWRTFFEMGRCLLIGSKLPHVLWPYAVMASSYIRNRCFQERTSQTPYFLLTGQKPNLSNMHVFGSICYSYIEKHKAKLDPRSKRGMFVGYDKESPAFLVYCPDTRKVMRCRCVKFTDLIEIDDDKKDCKEIGSDDVGNDDDDDFPDDGSCLINVPQGDVVEVEVPQPSTVGDVPAIQAELVNDEEGGERRYPRRERNRPAYLESFELEDIDEEDVDEASRCMDFCKMMNAGDVPNTYTEAIGSKDSREWKEAMDEEMNSLYENKTFDVVPLPHNKKSVGGRWIYSVKEGPGDMNIFKARYVAKGFTQVYGSDYFETFSPTAKVTSIRILMQLAVQYNLLVHQMDVKTAYLNAPIDVDIYVKQPEGYVLSGKENFVCKLNKSLYGLKQSGRNWNNMLHQFFIDNNFIQSPVDPCIYFCRCKQELVIALIWVDDILLAANSVDVLSKSKSLLKDTFKMKYLGPVSSFLGMNFVQTCDTIEVDQSKYLSKILVKFGMEQSKPRSTPCEMKPSAFSVIQNLRILR